MKDTYVDYGVLPSRINVKLENHTYKLTSNILDRDNGTWVKSVEKDKLPWV